MVHSAYVGQCCIFSKHVEIKKFRDFLDAFENLLESVIKFDEENNNKTNAI